MFQNADKKGLADKEPLAGEIQEGETSEVYKESSNRRRWVALCWLLTWWVPSFLLTHLGRMKRQDVRQAWREKLAINIIIWFSCGVAVFVIAILGLLICPTEHVFSTSELQSHSVTGNANNVFTAIRGEVFDLNAIAITHSQYVSVVPQKSILKYGGQIIDNLFPVQVQYILYCVKTYFDIRYRSAPSAMASPGSLTLTLLWILETKRIQTPNTTISESVLVTPAQTGTLRA
jgi:chitin synthase